jgi:KTSC domain
MSGFQAASIEDQFVDAVRSALETAPDWSAEPVTILRRTVQGHIEMVKFDDSSYMSRAAYDLTANDLTVALTNGEFLRVARIPVEYWDGLLAAPSKGGFFVRYIEPSFDVKKLGWLRRMCVQLKSRRQIP